MASLFWNVFVRNSSSSVSRSGDNNYSVPASFDRVSSVSLKGVLGSWEFPYLTNSYLTLFFFLKTGPILLESAHGAFFLGDKRPPSTVIGVGAATAGGSFTGWIEFATIPTRPPIEPIPRVWLMALYFYLVFYFCSGAVLCKARVLDFKNFAGSFLRGWGSSDFSLFTWKVSYFYFFYSSTYGETKAGSCCYFYFFFFLDFFFWTTASSADEESPLDPLSSSDSVFALRF